MVSKGAAHDPHGERGLGINEHLRGAAIVALGALGLIGLAWGVMMVLTAPDGWVTKAANSALFGENAQLVSVAEDPAQ